MEGIGTCQGFLKVHEHRIKGIARKALWILHCTGPEAHSEDVASEVVRKIVQYWKTLNSPEHALYTIIVNTARDHAKECNSEVAQEIHDSASPCFMQAGRDPEEMLSDAILMEELLSQLKPIERIVIELTFHGHSSAIIGEILSIPSSTVRSIKSHAVVRLRAIALQVEHGKSAT
jgi:RNA polymerase sigma factor (sigma-70 family)